MKKILFAVSIIVLLSAGCNSARKTSTKTQIPITQNTNASPTSTPTSSPNSLATEVTKTFDFPINISDWKTYSGEENHFIFKYPDNLFNIYEKDYANAGQSGVGLTTKYCVDSSLKEGVVVNHCFTIIVDRYNRNLVTVANSLQPSANIFPDNKESSFKKQDGFMEKLLVGNKQAYRVITGVEGTNTDYIFVKESENTTVVITYNYVQPSAFSLEAKMISLKSQNEIFDTFLSNFKFTN